LKGWYPGRARSARQAIPHFKPSWTKR
jgi:hypothetical protein